MKKKDLIVIFIVVAVIAITSVFYFTTSNVSDAYIVVKANGETVYSEAYSKKLEHTDTIVRGNKTNTYVISNGEIYMEHANCPDQKCILQGKISLEDYFLPIICAPNGVVISIESSDNLIDG